ncbi:kinase-like domain-containing protein [Rhizophagus diaphanus]|nr:kinase-like domain-containing protein [Rhizophagus diaphanus] [Rhizophagus sp. MUCL 43196]
MEILKNLFSNISGSKSTDAITTSITPRPNDTEKLNLTEECPKLCADEINTFSFEENPTNKNADEADTLSSDTIITFNTENELKTKVIFLHCTGSMGSHIVAASLQVTNYIKHTNPSIELRVSFCGYRDHNDGRDRLQSLDFTYQYKQFTTYIQSVKAYSSPAHDDDPEDVLGGLNAAITKMYSCYSSFGDYPTHGRHYTEKMLQIFRGIIGEFSVFDLIGGDSIKLIENFIKATSTSITYAVSMTSTIGSNSKDGVIMWYPILDTLDELKDSNYFKKSKIFSRSFSFKIASQPFSASAEKYAYFALDIKSNPAKKMVMKEYLHVGRNDPFEKYIEAIEISTTASFLSTEFNFIAERKNIPNVKFLNVKLLRCGTIDFYTRHYTIEPKFHNVEYIRFNVNTGVITELRPTLEAFVHFTYEYTKGYLVVCDLQGAELNSEFLLTDHCIDSLRFGKTNFGKGGNQSVVFGKS